MGPAIGTARAPVRTVSAVLNAVVQACASPPAQLGAPLGLSQQLCAWVMTEAGQHHPAVRVLVWTCESSVKLPPRQTGQVGAGRL